MISSIIGSFLVDNIIPTEFTEAVVGVIGGIYYSFMIVLSYIAPFLYQFIS